MREIFKKKTKINLQISAIAPAANDGNILRTHTSLIQQNCQVDCSAAVH